MKSGMLAAEAVFEAVMQNTTETTSYEEDYKAVGCGKNYIEYAISDLRFLKVF